MSLKCLSVVRAVDAWKRKKPEWKAQSFFGIYDVWKYIPIFDKKLCPRCLMHATTTYFLGKYLRPLFPYLEIIDENSIRPKTHINCRCILLRVIDPAEYLMATKGLYYLEEE